MAGNIIPPPRPLLWSLRAPETAETTFDRLADGRRCIVIRHAELKGVAPEMLTWWYRHIIGDMEYCGSRWPRFLVWHPLDHISYDLVREASGGGVGAGARLHIREAFQRNPDNLLDITVTVERIDNHAAIIGNRILGLPALTLTSYFEPTPMGTDYITEMVIGASGAMGRLLFNRLVAVNILPQRQIHAWVRHHVEEVGNLENFLPQLYREEHLYRKETASSDAKPRRPLPAQPHV